MLWAWLVRRLVARARARPVACLVVWLVVWPAVWPAVRLVGALVALSVLTLTAREARAELPTLSGTWSASALSESWSTSEWGEACGPKPTPQGAGGGSVQVREQGSELSMVGGGRAFTTAECWERMPGLGRASHSASKRAWSTRCTTPAGDPRRATVVTTVSATDTSIQIRETGQYEFYIQDTACKASVVRSRSLSLVQREGDVPEREKVDAGAPAPQKTAEPKPAPPAKASEGRCDSPGEPARLEVTPSKKLLRVGERFTVRALVLDAAGCPAVGKPTFRLEADESGQGPELALRVDDKGEVVASEGAREGAFTLQVSVQGKSVKVAIELVDPARYQELLRARGLDERGELAAPAVAALATGGVGGKVTQGQDVGRERKQIFVAVVVGVALALALAALVLARRGRRRRELEGPSSVGPSSVGPSSVGSASPGRPAELLATSARPAARRVCPTCGERYEGEAEFCGKDGTVLVPLN